MSEIISSKLNTLKGKVVGVKNPDDNKPLFGELIEVNDQFITIEDINGHISIINVNFINAIWATRNTPVSRARGRYS